MKNILKKGFNECSSCGLCAVACPQNCIQIKSNSEGFYRPIVNEQACTQCGICQSVCYKYLTQKKTFINFFEDKKIIAAWSKNSETLFSSSSGGISSEILNWGIENNYHVSGVIFDSQKDICKHTIAKTVSETEGFKSSKYLQSYTKEAFSQFEKDKQYIVVGTPCQIYGLRKWIKLKKRENDFILIDFFCHGTPSVLLWKKYKEYIQKKHQISTVKEILFRSKEKSSWHKNTIKIKDIYDKEYINTNAFAEDLFFKLFLSDNCLNKSCYNCLLRLDYCASDIRIGDFWGNKYKSNEKGVSLITLNTIKGETIFNHIQNRMETESCSFSDLQDSQKTRFLRLNNKKRNKTLRLLQGKKGLNSIYKKTTLSYFSLTKRLVRKIKRVLYFNNSTI